MSASLTQNLGLGRGSNPKILVGQAHRITQHGIHRQQIPATQRHPLQRVHSSLQKRDSLVHESSSAPSQLTAGPDAGSYLDRRNLLLGGVAGVVASTCLCCRPLSAQANDWAYGEISGPAKWSGVCAAGKGQSPIDVGLSGLTLKPNANDFRFSYATASGPEVLNTGHGTMQVNLPAGNIASLGDRQLELIQFHFHTPSEHAIDGRRFPMEVHLVHKDKATGGLAVLGVLMQPGGVIPNPALQAALDSASSTPLAKTTAKRSVDVSAFLPRRGAEKHRPFVHYVGSLTTPPCSESVDWFLFTRPISVPDSQILDFLRFVGGGSTYATNARPLQPLNGRQLEYEL